MKPGRYWPAWLPALAAAILIAPVWAVELPALPDLPAHLACFFLLGGGIGEASLGHFYRIDWQFVPNLASEITVPFLAWLMGLVPADKLFLSAAIAAWVFGAAAIKRALFGGVGVAALFAAFFAYNANYFWGFMNYDFSAGLGLLVFAAWIATDDWSRPIRLAAFALAATVVYFCHVFAFAVLLLFIGCYELDRLLRERAVLTRRTLHMLFDMLALAVVPAAAFLFLKPKAADGGHLEFNLLSTWDDRLGAAFQSRFDDPGYIVLALLALVWLVCVER